MPDSHLTALVDAHRALPFPAGLRGEEIEGVDLVMLDADTFGVATHYVRNDRGLTGEHARMLEKLVADANRVLPLLRSAEARAYYASVHAIGAHLLASRDIHQR